MPQCSCCPDEGNLQSLVECNLPEDRLAAVTQHLEGCDTCQDRVEALAADRRSWSAAVRHLRERPGEYEEPLRRVVEAAKAAGREFSSDASAEAHIAVSLLGPPAKPGQLGRLGPYEVLKILGQGGMGIVYQAFDPRLERVVAIKILSPHLATIAAARERFVREARAAARIRNEHVVTVHAVEEIEGLPCLVMEYIPGESLHARLDREGALPLPEVIRIGAETANGLAAAHAHGVIHRDVKPANILVEEGSDRVKITDFGLACAAGDGAITRDGMVAGTPQYMSPEQAAGTPLDQRTDQFSLGSVLYALCTGRPPFTADSPLATLKQVCDQAPRPVRELNPAIPQWLEAVIAKLHAKKPAARFQTAAEVAELLGRHPASHAPSHAHYGRRLLAAGLMLAFGLAAYLYGGTVYRVATNQGQLVIETEGTDVEVKINGDEVTIVDTKTRKQVNLKAGRYQIELADAPAGLKLATSEFTLERGGKEIVRVRLESTVTTQWRPLDHEGANAVVFSADSTRVFSGGWDRTARLWDVASGNQLHCFDFKEEGKNRAIYCVAIAPDGKRALAGSRDGQVWYLDLENGEKLKQCDHPKTPDPDGYGVTSLAISPDGRQALLGSFDGVVRVWDLEKWKELQRFQHSPGLWIVDYSPDGRFALTSNGRGPQARLCLWDLKSVKELRRRELPGACGRAVFSPDGRFAASGSDRTMRLWRLDTWEEVRAFPHPLRVTGVCFTPDGNRLVSGCDDAIVRLWDAKSGRELHRFIGSAKEPWSVAVSPDGRFVAATSVHDHDGVTLWKLPK